MAFDPSDLIAAIRSTGIPGTMAFAGIYTGTTAANWMPDFQGPVSMVGIGLLGCSGIWFFGTFAGRITGWRWLQRLEGKETVDTSSALPPPS